MSATTKLRSRDFDEPIAKARAGSIPSLVGVLENLQAILEIVEEIEEADAHRAAMIRANLILNGR
jgi:hypothetical protein